MNRITITNIFWKKHAIGIKLSKLASGDNLVRVIAEDKNDNYYYPNLYKINREEVIRKYGVDSLENNPNVKIVHIPLDDLESYIDVGRTAIDKFSN